MHRILHAYAEGRPGRWEAVCLDFDLAVQGESFEQVYRELGEAITLYVETVSALPEDDQKRLLRRAAPLSVQLRFLYHALETLLRRGRFNNDPKQRADFLLSCPA